MTSNNYDTIIRQLKTKLERQEQALAATKLHLEAIQKLQGAPDKQK